MALPLVMLFGLIITINRMTMHNVRYVRIEHDFKVFGTFLFVIDFYVQY